MVIRKIKDDTLPKEMIEIKYHPDHIEAIKLIESIEASQHVLMGYQEDISYPITFHDFYYAESIDDKVILYTKSDSYTSSYKLYQLEELHPDLVRVHKSMIVNLTKIKAFKTTINAKLEAMLDNGEKIEINRTYVKTLKERMHRI